MKLYTYIGSIKALQNPQKYLTSDDLKGSFQGHKSPVLGHCWLRAGYQRRASEQYKCECQKSSIASH